MSRPPPQSGDDTSKQPPSSTEVDPSSTLRLPFTSGDSGAINSDAPVSLDPPISGAGDEAIPAKPHVDFLTPAIKRAKQATVHDENKEYDRAIPLYLSAIDCFMISIKHESNPERRKMLRGKVVFLMDRTEVLRGYVASGAAGDSGPPPSVPPAEEQPSDPSPEVASEPIPDFVDFVGPAIRHAREATAADEAKNYELAFPLYRKAIDTFMVAVKYEKDLPRRKMLRDKVVGLMQRAEAIKRYLALNGTASEDSTSSVVDTIADTTAESNLEEEDSDKKDSGATEATETMEQEEVEEERADFLSQGIEAGKAATEADSNEDYVQALPLYMKAVQFFLSAVEQSSDPSQQQLLLGKITALTQRVESLQEYMEAHPELFDDDSDESEDSDEGLSSSERLEKSLKKQEEMLVILEQRHQELEQKADDEYQAARACLKSGDRAAAREALLRKKSYTAQAEKLLEQKDSLETMHMKLEEARVQSMIMKTTRQAAEELKGIQESMGGVEGVQRVIGEARGALMLSNAAAEDLAWTSDETIDGCETDAEQPTVVPEIVDVVVPEGDVSQEAQTEIDPADEDVTSTADLQGD